MSKHPNGEYYTDEQRIEIIREFIEHDMSYRKAVEHFNVSKSSLERWKKKYGHLAQKLDNHEIRGTSTLYDAEGNARLTWVKTSKTDEEIKERLQAFADGLKDDIPRCKPIPPPKATRDDLLACYVLTDTHIGMRSDEWNLEIAERTLKNFIDNAIDQAPDCHTGLFCQLGDASHWDSMIPVTPANKHVLDADCSSHAMIRMVIKIMRYGIDRMLQKHQHVHVVAADANHDPYSSIWTREMLSVLYENEPRVTVDTTPVTYYAYEWGQTSLFFHHGHKRNLNQVSNVFAGMFREIFGRTKYSYGHIGHYHHTAKIENQMMQVEIHPTLAGKDDYAINGGWLSQRGANTIIYHKDHGEVGRITIRPEMC